VTTTEDDEQLEFYNVEELVSFPVRYLRELAAIEGVSVHHHATKAEIVARLLDLPASSIQIPLTPEQMLREAIQLRSWVRGVPPRYACLTADDKRFINWMHDLLPAVLRGLTEGT
jgi:hypothetical protein